jgi:hypothetical protein
MAYHHWVPRFLMRIFGVNEKQIARFDKRTGEKKIVPISSFCGEEGYFAFDDRDLDNLPWYCRDLDKNTIEKLLGQHIEGPLSSKLEILNTEKTLEAISESDLRMILEWAAWMFIANPHSIALSSIQSFANSFNNIDFSKLTQKDKLKLFVQLHELIFPVFLERGWILQQISSSHGRLLSSDRPVMIGGISLNESPNLSNQTILFPISPNLLLVGNNESSRGYASKPLESTKNAALMTNILTFHQANRFIFGTSISDIDNVFNMLIEESKT